MRIGIYWLRTEIITDMTFIQLAILHSQADKLFLLSESVIYSVLQAIKDLILFTNPVITSSSVCISPNYV